MYFGESEKTCLIDFKAVNFDDFILSMKQENEVGVVFIWGNAVMIARAVKQAQLRDYGARLTYCICIPSLFISFPNRPVNISAHIFQSPINENHG